MKSFLTSILLTAVLVTADLVFSCVPANSCALEPCPGTVSVASIVPKMVPTEPLANLNMAAEVALDLAKRTQVRSNVTCAERA